MIAVALFMISVSALAAGFICYWIGWRDGVRHGMRKFGFWKDDFK